jgi:hypothetical protein
MGNSCTCPWLFLGLGLADVFFVAVIFLAGVLALSALLAFFMQLLPYVLTVCKLLAFGPH